MYKIYLTQGQGECFAHETSSLEEAIEFVNAKEQCGQGSFGIKKPDGSWHQW